MVKIKTTAAHCQDNLTMNIQEAVRAVEVMDTMANTMEAASHPAITMLTITLKANHPNNQVHTCNIRETSKIFTENRSNN